ncbi:MAG: hypothetical protein WKF57_04105 [Nakamurella sp.]
MNKKGDRLSFADIVQEVRSSVSPEPPLSPGLYGDAIVDEEGRVFELVGSDISEDRALTAARAGAHVLWDACGCGGGCSGVRRYVQDEIQRMALSGPPVVRRTKRHHGRISEFRAADGSTLLLAEMSVTWGGVLG